MRNTSSKQPQKCLLDNVVLIHCYAFKSENILLKAELAKNNSHVFLFGIV